MKVYVILRCQLREVGVPPQCAVAAAREVALAETRLKESLNSWPSLETSSRIEAFRWAVFDTVTVASADPARGAVWVDALAKLRVMKKRQLAALVEYRVSFLRNLPLLYAHDRNATTEEVCNLILT